VKAGSFAGLLGGNGDVDVQLVHAGAFGHRLSCEVLLEPSEERLSGRPRVHEVTSHRNVTHEAIGKRVGRPRLQRIVVLATP
jgi:hypothetical protein